MDEAARTLLGICRFCLSKESLSSLSKAIDFEFTIQDVERIAGVQITEDEQRYCAICDECCHIFENAVALRITSASNYYTFKYMLSAFIESMDGDPIETEKASIPVEVEQKSNTFPLDEQSAECGEDPSDEVFQSFEHSSAVEARESESRKDDAIGQTAHKPRELCNICGRMVFSYKQHSIAHSKELNFDCPYCPKKFKTKAYQNSHIKTIHVKKIYKSCGMCGKEFTHRNSYTTHMVAKHGIGKKYECRICFKSYNRSSHYTDHFNKAHGNREHPCTICGKIFKSKNLLQGHKSVHSDDQPYACSLCPKRFKSRDAKKNHEITHSGVRFACQLCDKSYGYKTLLSAHYRKHHDGAVPSETENPDSNTYDLEINKS